MTYLFYYVWYIYNNCRHTLLLSAAYYTKQNAVKICHIKIFVQK